MKGRGLISMVVLLASILVFVMTTYAVIEFSIQEQHPYKSATDDFYLTTQGKYWQSVTAPSASHSLTVTRRHATNAVFNPYFDLVVIYENDIAPTLTGTTNESGDDEAFDITYINESNIEVAAKAAVFKKVGVNTVIADELTANDSLPTAPTQIATPTETVTYNTVDTTVTVGFSTAVSARFVVLPYSDNNAYAASFFDLQMINNEGAHDIAVESGYKNVYFLSDVTIDSAFTTNIPCHIDFLWSNVTLNAPWTINHGGYGRFSMCYIADLRDVNQANPVDNTNAPFNVTAPLAYYEETAYTGEYASQTGGAIAFNGTTVVRIPASYTKSSDGIDFTTETELRTALLADALAYAKRSIPTRIYSDLALETTYHNYDVTFGYTLDGTEWDGAITRNADTVGNSVGITVSGYGGSTSGTVGELYTEGNWLYDTNILTLDGTAVALPYTVTIDGTAYTLNIDTAQLPALTVPYPVTSTVDGKTCTLTFSKEGDNQTYTMTDGTNISNGVWDYQAVVFDIDGTAVASPYIVNIGGSDYAFNIDTAQLSSLTEPHTVSSTVGDVSYHMTFYEDNSYTITRDYVRVIGTSDAAISDAFASTLDEHIKSVSDKDTGFDLAHGADVRILIADFLDASGYAGTLTMDLTASHYLSLYYDSLRYNHLTAVKSGDAYLMTLADTTNPNQTVTVNWLNTVQTDAKSIVLTPSTWVLETIEYFIDGISVTAGGATPNAVNVSLKSMTMAERQAYINRYMETVYLANVGSTGDLITLVGEKIYFGDNRIQANAVIDSNLGFTGITYTAYKIDESDLAAVLADGTLPTTYEDYSTRFIYTNGLIEPVSGSSLRLSSQERLVYIATFTHGGGTYSIARQIIIPESGLGGSEYEELQSGDTFSEYFDNLPDGRLIDSTADTSSSVQDGSGNRFVSGSSQIALHMEILSTTPPYTGDPHYCEIVGRGAGGSIIVDTTTYAYYDYWQIKIDIESVPDYNSIIQLRAVFILMTPEGSESVISTQDYSFIIPGIYRTGVGGDIPDVGLYNSICNATVTEGANVHLFESFTSGENTYLLVDGAQATVDEFDYSTAIGNTATLDLTGINLLTGTKSFIFDNWILQGVDCLWPFSQFDTYNVTKLSLKNCGITDAAFKKGHLYSLNTLEELYLDGNGIVSLTTPEGVEGTPEYVEGLIYRTVKTLSLADNDLTSIDGIESIIELETVYLQNNSITSFKALRGNPNLANAYVYGNTATDFAHNGDTEIYYGTSGEINIPVYVALIDKGVNVYASANPITPLVYGDDAVSDANGIQVISHKQKFASWVLNAIVTFDEVQSSIIDFPSSVGVNTTGSSTVYNITVNYAIVNGTTGTFTRGTNTVEITTTLADNDKIKLIVSTVHEGTTVYAEFEFVYTTVNP